MLDKETLEYILDILIMVEDEGLNGEGWKSEKLMCLVETVRKALGDCAVAV